MITSLRKRFNEASDYTKYGVLLGMSYAAHLSFMHYMRGESVSDLATTLAYVAALSLSLRIPYVRKIPLKLMKIFNFSSAGKTSEPSAEILEDVEDLRQKFHIKEKVRTYILESKNTDNAYTDGDKVYLGRDLVNTEDRGELKFTTAHEMAHINSKDVSEYLPFAWPLSQAAWFALGAVPKTFLVPLAHLYGKHATDMGPLPTTAAAISTGVLAMGLLYYHLLLSSKYSRVVEARTDRMAVEATGDPESAIRSLSKHQESEAGKESRLSKLFYSHPSIPERIHLISQMKCH